MQTLIHNKLHLPTEKGNQVWQHARPISLTQDTEIAACLSCDQQVRGVLGSPEGTEYKEENDICHILQLLQVTMSSILHFVGPMAPVVSKQSDPLQKTPFRRGGEGHDKSIPSYFPGSLGRERERERERKRERESVVSSTCIPPFQ